MNSPPPSYYSKHDKFRAQVNNNRNRFAKCVCVFLSIFVALHILLLQTSSSPDFFNTDTHWKRGSEASKVLGLLYGIYPTAKNSRCIIMPHYHLIGNPNQEYYHTPGFVNCFNRNRCKYKSSSPVFKNNHLASGLTVAIYPENTIEIKMLNGNILKTSNYFKEVLKSIRSSPFYVEDPKKACVLVPNIDHTLVNSESDAPFRIAKELRKLKYWNNGMNHLLFNKHDDPTVQYDTGLAMVAKVGFSWPYYRPNFDISMMPPTGWAVKEWREQSFCGWAGMNGLKRQNKYLLTFKGRLTSAIRHVAMRLHNGKDIIFVHSKWDYKNKYDYDDMMLHSEFALIIRGNGLYSYRLAEAVAAGAIPVIVSDHYILPFSNFLNWKDFSVLIPEHEMLDIPNILKSISPEQRKILRCNLFKAWKYHLRDINHHVNTAFEIISRRVYGSKGVKDKNGYLGQDGLYTTNFQPREANELTTGMCFDLENTDVTPFCKK
jgi:hypothetical protein